MAQQLKFLLDGTDRGQPLNPEDFGFAIAEDDQIGARVVSFNNDLLFNGSAYQYLFGKVVDRSFCQLIRVEVQYKCGLNWQKLVDGYIVVTETVFDLDRCQAKTKLYDESFSTKINNNKGIPFSLSCTVTKNLEPIVPPARRLIKMFNPAQPTSVFESGRGVSVYDAFTHLVGCMSDNLVDFESDFFFTQPSDTDTVCITNGRSLRTNQDIETVVSFEQLYTNLKAKYNLGAGFFKQPNGRPVLRIEPIEYFFGLNQSASLLDQPNVDFRFDTQKIYAAVQFGNSPVLEANESSSPNDPPQSLTFIQTPFRGFRQERFGFTGECNTSNVLNVETSSIIFDTNTIEDIIRFNSESYDLDNIVIQVQYVSSATPYFEAKQYDPYNIGQSVFNGGFTNDEVSANWLNGYPSSLFSFLEEPFDPALTNFNVFLSPASETFNQIKYDADGGYISILSFTGHNAYYLDEVSDPNDLFSFDTYTVPFVGLYTFSAGIIFEALRVDGFPFAIDPTNYGRDRKFFIQHYDRSDNFITEVSVSNSGSSNIDAWSELNSVQFVCNVGDKIKVNASGKRSTQVGGFLSIQNFLDNATVLGIDRQSYFTGIGQPLNPEELAAVNTEDVRTFLYEFERPLSMDEITSILNATSSPIELGRTTDPNAAIDGYIKTMEVQSVTRQNAKFVLKSNEILR